MGNLFSSGDLVTIKYVADRVSSYETNRLRSKVSTGGIYLVKRPLITARNPNWIRIELARQAYRGCRLGGESKSKGVSGTSPHTRYWLEMDDYSQEWFYEEELELVFSV